MKTAKHFIAIILLIFAFCKAYTQATKTKATQAAETNKTDALGAKQGYWILRDTSYYMEADIIQSKFVCYDTLYSPRIRDSILKMKNICREKQVPIKPQKRDTTRILNVAKGNFLNGNKNGTWTYYLNDTILLKEVSYQGGQIQSFRTFYPNGKRQLEGYQQDPDNCNFKKYDPNGKLIQEGKAPLQLLYLTANTYSE